MYVYIYIYITHIYIYIYIIKHTRGGGASSQGVSQSGVSAGALLLQFAITYYILHITPTTTTTSITTTTNDNNNTINVSSRRTDGGV